MSDDLEFIVIDDIPEYIFCIGDDEENEQVIALSGKDGAFKYEKVAELPTTGEDGVLYLVPKAHTTQTASGNPISVNITDGAGKIESLKLDGDTYQQTYTGKNLLTFGGSDISGNKNGITYSYNAITQEWLLNGTATSLADILYPSGAEIDMHLASGVRYTTTGFYQSGTISNGSIKLFQQDSIHGWQGITVTMSSAADSSEGFTPNTDIVLNESHIIRVAAGTVLGNFKVKFQTEQGSTPTDFEPYVGGQASPSPSYPQDINVVTGTQTISINGTDYPLDLGDIQLCGLGDDGNGNPLYKDHIYKDGDDWKVHKVTGKYTFTDASGFIWGTDRNRLYIGPAVLAELGINFVPPASQTSEFYALSEKFKAEAFDTGYAASYTGACFICSSGRTWSFRGGWANETTARSALANTTVYYALATPTDTTITDQTLIAQLEAVRTAALSTGSNTISNTATGTNLAGDLELGYYGYDPLNKYDKYFWLDIDGGYESL